MTKLLISLTRIDELLHWYLRIKTLELEHCFYKPLHMKVCKPFDLIFREKAKQELSNKWLTLMSVSLALLGSLMRRVRNLNSSLQLRKYRNSSDLFLKDCPNLKGMGASMGLLMTPVFIFLAIFSLWIKFLLNLVFRVSSYKLDLGLPF